jgi:hypothetical protein
LSIPRRGSPEDPYKPRGQTAADNLLKKAADRFSLSRALGPQSMEAGDETK